MYWENWWVSFTQYSECFHLKVSREYFYVKVLGKLSERYCVKGIGRIGYYQWKISFGSSRNAAMQLARERTPLKPYQCFSPIQSINLARQPKFYPSPVQILTKDLGGWFPKGRYGSGPAAAGVWCR